MKKSSALTAAAAVFCAVATVGPAAAQNQYLMEMGPLECTIAASVGAIAGTSKSVECRFIDVIGIDSEGISQANRPDFYFGSIDGVGLDVGSAQQQVVDWVVFAPATMRYYPGELAGGFAGVSAEATPGLGLGPHLLIGGFNGTFVLQPSSVEAQTGANIALGVTAIKLVAR